NNNYSVTLIVTGSNGCVDSATVPVPVFYIPPVAGYVSITPACSHTTVFTNQSSFATNYNWDFGDSTTSSLVNPVHDYQNTGNYVVTLIVSTPDGCADTTASPVVINPIPVAGYTSVIDTCSLHASFNSTSQFAISYLWNFGDSSFSILPNPDHTYSTGGTYTVSLIVTNSNGCTDTLIQTVSPHLVSEASYAFVIDSCEKFVNFINQTNVAAGYQWNFGDGETSTDYSAAHYYAADGNYSVILIANPGTMCADTAEYEVDYHMDGVGDLWIPNAFTPNNDSKNDIFEVVGDFPCGDLTFTVLDRWGEVLYQTTQRHITWDGLYKGERVKQGVYVYILEGAHYLKIGSITVMR
ncbi:MAG: PKD domain-containing protein, partial [Bacteroidia bacterium]|nr:PKD domain-containing protein [Bacteroidia bacterium]